MNLLMIFLLSVACVGVLMLINDTLNNNHYGK